MAAFIALFRGINVGGNSPVRMADLRAMFADCGYADAASYVQSGNVVFAASSGTATAHARKIAASFAERFGFEAHVMVRDRKNWDALIKANPFPEAADEPARLHVCILDRKPDKKNAAALEEKGRTSERYYIVGDVLYLHTPDGIGRSKFAGAIERTLGVPATARNWRTVLALADMAGKIADG